MEGSAKHPLVLALGNDLLGDDAVGLYALRLLRESYGEQIDAAEAAGGGLELLDILEGHTEALLLDSITSTAFCAGTVLELSPEDFSNTAPPSPHFVGLPEVLGVAAALDLPMPRELRVVAMVVDAPCAFGDKLGEEVRQSLPFYLQSARSILDTWLAAEPNVNRENSVSVPASSLF
ncbi:MAG TPA: hydrogenase maturation protease [Bacteroidota bacterium]|nr:hydrogenase maturation protease [Bacteroidota bacterium]